MKLVHKNFIGILLLGGIFFILSPSITSAGGPQFIRGDVNQDGNVDITDPILGLQYLFLGVEVGDCLISLDTDASDFIDITDNIWTLVHLFQGLAPPRAPYPDCGFAEPGEINGLDCAGGHEACDPFFNEITQVQLSFQEMTTIAGKGENLTDSNAWQSSFEGGLATEAELSRPHMALGDDQGNLYIADKDAHAIRKVTPDGKIHTVAGTGTPGFNGDDEGPATSKQLNEPNGLWVQADGTFYILDKDNERIRKVDTEGTMSTLFQVPGLRTGRGLWVSDDETLAYVASRSALASWTPEHGVRVLSAGFSQLGNFIVRNNGEIIATDRNANLVYRVDSSTGEKEIIAGNGSTSGGGDGEAGVDTGLNQVRGVWEFQDTGGLFLATQTGSQVWYLDTEGTIHLMVDGSPNHSHSGDGEHFTTEGQKVSNIRSVTQDRQGNLLITEHDGGFVRKVIYELILPLD